MRPILSLASFFALIGGTRAQSADIIFENARIRAALAEDSSWKSLLAKPS